MANQTEPKIKCSVGLTSRQVSHITAEAKRSGVSFGDTARRLIDWAIDSQQPKERILVLDREKNELRGAR